MIRATAWMIAIGAATVACSSTPTTPGTSTASVVVSSATTSGASFQLTATAHFSDGTARDVTSESTWRSSNPQLASVSSTGAVSVLGTGELDLQATYQSVTGTLHVFVATLPVVSVTIAGAPSATASSFQASAVARFSDGSTQDVTRGATWTSSNAQVAAVTASGYVAVAAAGEVDISATYQSVVGSAHVSVLAPTTVTVTGTVREPDPLSRAVSGARVQIIGGNFALTDAQGRFTLRGVVAGRTIFEVSKDGYQTVTRDTTIDKDTDLAFTLTPNPTP